MTAYAPLPIKGAASKQRMFYLKETYLLRYAYKYFE